MLLLPVTLLVTAFAILFRPVTRIVRADYDVRNPFMGNVIADMK